MSRPGEPLQRGVGAERRPAASIPACAQAASSAGASPETPTAPSRSRPSADQIGRPPGTVTTCGAKAKPGVPRAPFRHLRGREAPGRGRLRLGDREVHDARTVAVHPEHGDEMAARIDDGDGVALVPAGRVAGAARDDRLRQTRVKRCGARVRRGAGQSKHGNDDLLHTHLPGSGALSPRRGGISS